MADDSRMAEEKTQPEPPPPAHSLPVGTVIGGLEITGLIGEGGFGIVYRAYDATLQRHVALKEYMPSALASRSAQSAEVSVKSPRFADTFNAGLRSFVNEARLLAHFDHPALVKVHQFWQANRTAYMVMPFYEGPTLKAYCEALAREGQAPDEATLRAWLAPLLDALEQMHDEQCYHRDIAPDNILLTAKGPLLLDFGAARRVISDMTHALTVILKPGYAPIEQYGEAASMAQGPWTDLYALASVVYFCTTGRSPITSVERVMGDPLPRLAQVAAGRYSEGFLRAIDMALGVKPNERPQSVAALRALLDKGAAVASAAPEPAPAQTPEPAPAQTPAPAPAEPAPRRRAVQALAALAVAAAGGAAWLSTRTAAPPLPAAPPRPAPAAAPAAAPASAPAPAPAPAPVPAPVPAPAAAPAPVSTPAPPTRAPARAPTPPPAGRPAPAAALAPTPALTPAPAPALAPAPPPVRAPAPAAPAAPPPAPAAAPPARPPGAPARCAEILKKGQQQPLGLDEAEYLRKECR
jgi:hypothetical protein